MADVAEPDDLIMVQSVIDGSTARGSSVSSGGSRGWRFLGKIYQTR